MAKGKKLTPEVESIIAHVYEEDTKQTAKEVQQRVNQELRQSDSSISEDWPGVSAITKILTSIKRKNRQIKISPKDNPWSISDPAVSDIPSSILPELMKLNINRTIEGGSPLTVREVLWFARLYYFSDDKESIAEWSSIYAGIDRMAELLDLRQFNVPNALDLIMCAEIGPDKDTAQKALLKRMSEPDFYDDKYIKILVKLNRKAVDYEVTSNE